MTDQDGLGSVYAIGFAAMKIIVYYGLLCIVMGYTRMCICFAAQ